MEKNCQNCKYFWNKNCKEKCENCILYNDLPNFESRPLTNRQWLNKLSDEELAELTVREHILQDGNWAWFTFIWTGKICYPTREEAIDALIKTLQAEHEEK